MDFQVDQLGFDQGEASSPHQLPHSTISAAASVAASCNQIP